MKRIALLISAFVVITAFAGNGNPVSLVKKLHPELFRAERTIRVPDTPDCMKGDVRMQESRLNRMKAEEMPVRKDIKRPGGWLEMGRTGLTRAESDKLQLDSFVVMDCPTDMNMMRDIFEYNEDGWVIRHKPSKWDAKTNSWTSAKEYVYERDDEGYITTQFENYLVNDGINSQRVDYVYNEKKLGISQTFQKKLEDGEWHYTQKGEYKYDDRGNVIEELILIYNEDKKSWDNVALLQAEFDEYSEQFAEYVWDGTDWQGVQKKIYTDNENGTFIRMEDFIWKADTKEWLTYYKKAETYEMRGGKELWMKSESLFWNPDKQDWVGCYDWGKGVMYCTKTDFIYDDKGRETSQLASKLFEDGWKKRVVIETEWSVLENKEDCSIRRWYDYDEAEVEKIQDEEDEDHYNSNGMLTYKHIRLTADGGKTWTSLWKHIYEYLDGKYLLYGESYQFELKTGILQSGVNEHYEYDEDYNVIRSTYGEYLGEDNGESSWEKLTDFTYKYEQGIRTEKMAYRWNGAEYVKNWGEGWTWDFDVPVSDLVIGTAATTDWPCKMDEVYSYYELNGEWAHQKGTYHWSAVGSSSGIEEATNAVISISPNPVGGVLYIHADADVEVVLYSMQGMRMLVTQDKQINMSGFSSGLYIVEVNGVKTKIIKE